MNIAEKLCKDMRATKPTTMSNSSNLIGRINLILSNQSFANYA